MRLVRVDAAGLVIKPWARASVTVEFGEVLTAERLRSIWGLRLHRCSGEPLRIACRGAKRVAIEGALRRRGVRVVDCWGAIIAPTLLDFEDELARAPESVRQSSDSA